MLKIINAIIACCLTSIAIVLSICKIINKKPSFKEIIKFTIILTPIFSLTYIYFEGVSKVATTILIFAITMYFCLFNNNFYKSFYYAVVYEFLAIIVEIIICLIEIVVFNFNASNYYSSPFFILITTIINIILVYLICNIKILSKTINKLYNLIISKRKSWIFVIFITILLVLVAAYNGYNFKNNLSFYTNIIMTIFVIITVLFIIRTGFKNEKLENNYNEMMEYVQRYEKIINEQGKKNHEYNNQLTVIKGYSNNPKKLEEYINTIIEDHKCGQNYTIRQLSNFPDGGIKGLIYHKLSKMDDNKIKYYLYIDSESKDIFEKKFDIKTYQDITKLLGVFLDNAIDASKNAKEKEVELDIKNEDNCIIITISNTFDDKVDTKQIGKKGFTTKGKGHGYGLSIVKDINKHNKDIETFNDIEDDKFTQTILIYYK